MRTALRGTTLELCAPGLPALVVARRAGAARRVRIWHDDCDALDAGDDAADWASRGSAPPAGCAIRSAPRRLSSRDCTGDVSAPNQFSDGFPVLVANRASLDELNPRLAQPLPMNRFRPKSCSRGSRAWDEDRIDELRIGAYA